MHGVWGIRRYPYPHIPSPLLLIYMPDFLHFFVRPSAVRELLVIIIILFVIIITSCIIIAPVQIVTRVFTSILTFVIALTFTLILTLTFAFALALALSRDSGILAAALFSFFK